MADREYGLVAGDKRIQEIDERLKQLAGILAGGRYIPKKGDPNYTGNSGVTVDLPQFSEARNNLLKVQADLVSEKEAITEQLRERARAYVPIPGAITGIIKKEVDLAAKYGGTTGATAQIKTEVPTSGLPVAGPPAPINNAPAADTGVVGPQGGGTTKNAVRVTNTDIDDGLVQMGLTNTPENRKFVRDQLKKGTRLARNWETLIEQQAGEYAYLMQGAFGQDVADLMRRAVTQEWFMSDEGKKEFLDQFRRTEYYKNTTQKQQLFDKKTTADKAAAVQAEVDRIRSQFGEIQFDEMALNELAQTAARNGSSETELGRLVYRKAFQRGQVTPAATAAAETAIRSADADRVRAIYRAFGARPNDDEIRRILTQEADPATGTVMTEDMLRNQLRDTAKVTYGQFADMIDRGISVEKIFSPYQQVAASVLERTPDEISLVGENGVPTMYSEALMGEKPMSLTEWVKKLKVDPKYGYQFTNEAKQQVTKLVVDLEKAFGYRA